MTPTLPKQRLSDQVYGKLLDRIISGKLPLGSRLEPEPQLAKSLGVSRPILREALARLREDGVVVTRQGAGTVVERRPEERVNSLAPLASIADMQRCFEMRIGLECEAAYHAALRRQDNDMRALVESCERLEQGNLDVEFGGNEDFNFHLLVAAASHNRFFVGMLSQIREHVMQGMRINRTLRMDRDEERIRSVIVDHRRLVEVIGDRDGPAAKERMRQHIENAKSRIFEG